MIMFIIKRDISGEVFNIASQKQTSLLKIIKILQKNSTTQVKINFKDVRKGDIRHSLGSIKKLKQAGYTKKLTKIELGLAHII